MFSGSIEKQHWLHFLMSLQENIRSKWLDQKRGISANSNYTIN